MNALFGLRFAYRFVGMIRRVSVASGISAQVPDELELKIMGALM